MELSFEIPGNQENPKGNPLAYTRVTVRGLWLPRAVKYANWKEYVRGCYINSLEKVEKQFAADLLVQQGKPIKLAKGEEAFMSLYISWADGRHADPDNVFKGVCDSLFVDDKNVYGSFVHAVEQQDKIAGIYGTIKIYQCNHADPKK